VEGGEEREINLQGFHQFLIFSCRFQALTDAFSLNTM